MTRGRLGALDLDKLFAARLQAARARPYLTAALFALHTVESRRVPTMAADRHWRCCVSPGFVDRTPVEELAGVWVHECRTCCATTTGAATRFAREHGLTGPAERLRMNIAADCEIDDDAFGDGLVRPAGAVGPGALGLPEGELMEEYLSRFRIGPHTRHPAWLDCGSGADGLERDWDLGPDGGRSLSAQERDAVRFRVAQGVTGRPGDASKGVAAMGRGGVPPAAALAAVAGRGRPLGGLGPGSGEGLHLRPALPALGRGARSRPAQSEAQAAPGRGGRRHVRLGQRHRTGQRPPGGRRHLPCGGRPSGSGERALVRRGDPGGAPAVPGGGHCARRRWRDGSAVGFARALGAHPRPDAVVALTDGQMPWPSAPPPCRTVVVLFDRCGTRSWDEEDADYVPDAPPARARVVTIGRTGAAR